MGQDLLDLRAGYGVTSAARGPREYWVLQNNMG